jgi:hypothetical protein
MEDDAVAAIAAMVGIASSEKKVGYKIFILLSLG